MTSRLGANLQIRSMVPEDREFILSLTSRLAEAGSPPWRDQRRMQAFHEHYAEETANASGPNDAVLIAEDEDGQRLGVLHVTVSTDALTGEEQGYVATLAVTRSAEGRGVGRRLMEAAEAWCRSRGCRILALDVFAANGRARDFYGRLGFVDETLKMIKEL